MEKETRMGIRCTDEEKAKWESDAKKRGMALSVHVRDALNNYSPPRKEKGQK
jgi:hypothetical protein